MILQFGDQRAAEGCPFRGLAQKDGMVCTVPRAKRPDVTLDYPDVILIVGQPVNQLVEAQHPVASLAVLY
ncbi:MAG TPA: hypothetical protein VE135_24685 [Pyrinomonadaceae bacterium]|nr:hypothetical protein [Pyrinomonadaceae bacterium]